METKGLGGDFIICAFKAEDGSSYLAYTLDDTFRYIIDHPQYRYLAHNASGYEFAYLYEHILDFFHKVKDIEIVPTIQGESRLVQFKILKEGKEWIDMRDTLCLFNCSLAQVAASFCPDLPKGDIDWNEAHDNFDPSREDHMAYLWRDCEIILVAYRKHATTIWELFGSNLAVTAGSTAMKAYTATIPEGHVYYRLNNRLETFMRHGYYGAAVFPGHHVGEWGKTVGVDVNGAYGYQMRQHAFPVGVPARTHRYWPNELAMYRVIATVPHSLYEELGFNPIPHKTKKGLVWESGTFETTITSVDYEYGLSVGVEFEIIEGYVWNEQEYVFQDFIDKCQELELRDNGAYKPSTKLLRNTLYGKFGTKPDHTVILFSHEVPEKERGYIGLTNEITGEIIEDLYIGEEPTDAPYIMPHWAAFITAHERIYLFKFIQEAYKRGAKNIYCDTDSIKGDFDVIMSMVDDGTIPIGNMYGQFKVEEICTVFKLVGPKTFYGEYEDKSGKKKVTMKAKGVPYKILEKEMYEDALENKRKQKTFDAVKGLIRLIKQGGGKLPLIRKRTITDMKNSTGWECTNNGKIYPKGYRESLKQIQLNS